jgi:hypothetical protein
MGTLESQSSLKQALRQDQPAPRLRPRFEKPGAAAPWVSTTCSQPTISGVLDVDVPMVERVPQPAC